MPGIPVFNLAGTGVASTTTATVAWPTHATNDVALLLVQTAAEASALVTSAGFVQVSNSPQTTGTAAATNAVALQVFWNRATSASMPNVTLADAGDHVYARIITFTNVVTSGNPWNVTAGGVKAADSTNVAITGATTTVADSLIVAIFAHDVDTTTAQASTWTNANLANPAMAERADGSVNTGVGGGIGVGTGGLKLKGATGTTTVTVAAQQKNAFLMIALSPIEPTGTGTLAVSPAVAGSGKQTQSGSGSMAVSPSIAGSGKMQNFGPASVALAKPVVAASGTVDNRVNGTGSLVPIFVIAGAGLNYRQPSSIRPIMAGSGTVGAGGGGITGSGSLAIGVPQFSGTGIRGIIGSGSQAVAVPTMAASGQLRYTAAGAMNVAVPTINGTGIRGIIGSGAQFVTPSIAGSGQTRFSGSGSMTVPSPTMAGAGTRSILGSGSLPVSPVIAASGSVAGAGVAGAGSMAVPVPTITASGQLRNIASGAMSVAAPQISASGQLQHSANGVVNVGPTMSGSGTNKQQVVGLGDMEIHAILSGACVVEVEEEGLAGKYVNEHAAALAAISAAQGFEPEHASALQGINGARGFASEHASALRDLGRAGP